MDQDIINTLVKIQSICNQADDCSKCPFATTENECTFEEVSPIEWNINKDEIVKYFK